VLGCAPPGSAFCSPSKSETRSKTRLSNGVKSQAVLAYGRVVGWCASQKGGGGGGGLSPVQRDTSLRPAGVVLQLAGVGVAPVVLVRVAAHASRPLQLLQVLLNLHPRLVSVFTRAPMHNLNGDHINAGFSTRRTHELCILRLSGERRCTQQDLCWRASYPGQPWRVLAFCTTGLSVFHCLPHSHIVDHGGFLCAVLPLFSPSQPARMGKAH